MSAFFTEPFRVTHHHDLHEHGGHMYEAPTTPPAHRSPQGPPLGGDLHGAPRPTVTEANVSVPFGSPIAPPTDPRPGFATVGESRSRPVSVPPTESVSGPTFSQDRSRRSGRTFLAFLAGATMAAGSFGLGAILTNEEPAPIEAAATTPTPVGGSRSEDTLAPTLVPPAATTTDPVAAVATALGPSVLQVETDLGLGSGVVYDDGLILTNHHVIDGAQQIRVRTSDGRTFEADLLGSDARNDIAVLSVGPDSGLPIAALAAGLDLSVGQLAVAIGSPFQLSQTVTAGIVSAVNRPVPNTSGGFNAMIQTDAPINPGNSGGALADGTGRVIGINTSIRTDGTSNGNLGIGFAVPIDTALGVADRVTSGASLDAGVLGVMSASEVDNEIGVVIGEIVDGGAAESAGLVAGDRVVTIDGAPVTNFGEVVGLVQSKFAGEQIAIEVIRSNERVTLSATLG